MKKFALERCIIAVLLLLLLLSIFLQIARFKKDKEISMLLRDVKAMAPLMSFLNDEGELLGVNSFKWGDIIDKERFVDRDPGYSEGFLRICEDKNWLWDKSIGGWTYLLVSDGRLVGFAFNGNIMLQFPNEYYTEIVGREPDIFEDNSMKWFIGNVIVSRVHGGLAILWSDAEDAEVTSITLNEVYY